MKTADIRQFTSWLGKRSYSARLKRFGIERIREIARENGKKGGRPRATQKGRR
jgi:galactokinase/mevalonate kinase-like predicted kinase